MGNLKVHYSSKSSEWETPIDLFNELHLEFKFTLDVCANSKNAKLPFYYDKITNGLKQKWLGNCWCNPPYGKEIKDWIKKAIIEQSRGVTTVMLLPARTDTKWFHEYISKEPNIHIRFIKGRLKFGNSKNSAPFPSMVVIFHKHSENIGG